jgi:DNA-binding NarL/FixJ family response regulator
LARIAAEIAEHVSDEELSARQVEVLGRVALGNANKQVAAALNITEKTVKAHMTNIMNKLGASDRTHAVTIAVRRGFLDL